MTSVSLIGCGFVADLYMRSLATFPHIQITHVWDHDAQRLAQFCGQYGLSAAGGLDQVIDAHANGSGLILNLTNPAAHFQITQACLKAGCHVYSEKPLALHLDEAKTLTDLASRQGVILGSAPCSFMGEAAQTLAKAVRGKVAGTPRLVYAELDDGFIPQAPYGDWQSSTGAPWPAEDEFRTGCTLEHAGYYLTWLMAMFGPVDRVVAASAEVLPDKNISGSAAPDFSTATLFFRSGMVARLTCSIVAPHDHQIRVIGDKGVLKVTQAWDNSARVMFHKRVTLRRRLMELPVGRRVKPKRTTHPKVPRWGAAAMNFALGPAEILEALEQKRLPRVRADFALHLTEVTLAIQNAGHSSGAQVMTTTCDPVEPMPWTR